MLLELLCLQFALAIGHDLRCDSFALNLKHRHTVLRNMFLELLSLQFALAIAHEAV